MISPQFPNDCSAGIYAPSSERFPAADPAEIILCAIARQLRRPRPGDRLQSLAIGLSEALGGRLVFLWELPAPHTHGPGTLTLASGGRLKSSGPLALGQGILPQTLAEDFLDCPSAAAARYPCDEMLGEFGVESVMACPVRTDRDLGVIGVLGRGESALAPTILKAALEIFAKQAACELTAARARNQALEPVRNEAGKIAHEFNNLLTLILGNVSLAMMGGGLTAPLLEQLTLTKMAGLRAQQLTAHLQSLGDSGPAPRPPVQDSAPSRSNQGGRVLVIDDDPGVCLLLGTALVPLGFSTTEAHDGSTALEAYRRALQEGRRFDLVITDLTMPGGLSGMETARCLLQLDPQARVLVSSGNPREPAMCDFRRHGFCGTLPKPYDFHQLRAIIDAAIHPAEAA